MEPRCLSVRRSRPRRDRSNILHIGPGGSLALVGNSGHTGVSFGFAWPFIGLISADGTTERVIRTAPYYPYMLSVAPDGTFWTLGYEMVDHKISASELNPDAGVLRHFDRAGKLLGSTGPQSQFVKLYKSDRLDSGFLAATHDRIGWYAPLWGKGANMSK